VQSLLLVSQRVEPATLQRTGYEFKHPSLEAALRAVLDKPIR
jgi:NAD dependent epimerase/dehydratase family enzyme